MTASLETEATSIPSFPEDIERTINEVLLNDTKDMCGTMSLVASRFRVWTKPIVFHTVIIRRGHNDWLHRISECLLPNANLIRILALSLPCNKDCRRNQLPDRELTLIRQLLKASGQVRHLAVTWNIWDRLPRECGTLRLEDLYLIWDEVWYIRPPTLEHLQHPSELKDLTFYAPPDLTNPAPYRGRGQSYLPGIVHCVYLNYVTYAVSLPTEIYGCDALKGQMLVIVEWKSYLASHSITFNKERFSNFSAAYVSRRDEILAAWVAKMEGQPSILKHPPPHPVSL